MDGISGIFKEHQASFVFMDNVDEIMEEYMVVPSAVEDSFPTAQWDDFLLESNFAGVTGTILSPPNVEQVHHFCAVDEDGDRQQPNFVYNQDIKFEDDPLPESFLQQQQLLNQASNFGSVLISHGATAQANEDIVVKQYFDNIDFKFDCPVEQEQVEVVTAVEDANVWRDGQTIDMVQSEYSELEDPNSNWLAERADLDFIEQMTLENEQHCQLLDDLLRDDTMFQDPDPSSNEDYISEEREASEILSEIYNEAKQLDFTHHQPTNRSFAVTPVSNQHHQSPMAQQVLKPQFHLADHDFGSARRGRPPGSTKKRGTLKRDLKNKKQHQNREAALRYRLKKRAEKMEKECELEQLQKKNQFLKNEVYSLSSEVKYLKELLFEVRKLKGYQ